MTKANPVHHQNDFEAVNISQNRTVEMCWMILEAFKTKDKACFLWVSAAGCPTFIQTSFQLTSSSQDFLSDRKTAKAFTPTLTIYTFDHVLFQTRKVL